MADVHNKEIRSFNMSRIKGKNTKPELLVRQFLFSKGFRYRLHVKNLPGKPDIVLPKYKTVIFVHGCFWHGHDGCKRASIPETNTEWWLKKIQKNKQVDIKNASLLKNQGWKVITIFQCKLKPQKKEIYLENLIRSLREGITK